MALPVGVSKDSIRAIYEALTDTASPANAASGAPDDVAVTDPAEAGTVIGLLKGILTALNSIDAKTPAV